MSPTSQLSISSFSAYLRRPRLPLVWTAALAAAALACVPLVYLVVRAAEADADVWSSVLRGDTVRLLLNTAALAAAVTGARRRSRSPAPG